MKTIFFTLVLFLFSIAGNTQTLVENTNYASRIPDRIMLTIPGNAATSRAVTWRTSAEVEKSLGQIALAGDSPFFEDKIQTISGTSGFWMENDSMALGHKVIFEKLSPETDYIYRVGDGEVWSEWFQVTTSSSEEKPFNFIYLGDFQNDIKQHGSRAIRQACLHFPDAEFMLFAGDLVSRSTEDYWNEFFYAGQWIFGSKPSLATPGNHEYDKLGENEPRTFSKHWNQIFVNPANHPNNLKGRTYFLDYQGVRFISLDSPAMGNNEEDGKNTIIWLEKTLSENPNRWTILFTHYPVYSCSQGRNNETYRDALQPILEKYGVDLVLQGHDHTYCRGQNLDNVGKNCKNPPMYMVSVAGPKMYGLNVNRWSDRVASQTQLYQNITVKNNVISVETYTVTGKLYDAFQLTKGKNGINKVTENKLIKTIQEKNDIPESAKGKYTEDEINAYKTRYK